MISRRSLIGSGAALPASFLLGGRGGAAPSLQVIEMRSTPDGSDVWFDPVGLWVMPGTVVRWSNGAEQTNTHTSTAYHPANGHHALRIPEGARPWDSGYLLPGHSFDLRLTMEGIYDYFCQPHEQAGMVGRIVVGRARQATSRPRANWLPLPDEALKTFPPVETILHERVIRLPKGG